MKLELDKITILPICLQTSKTSVESLENVLINSFNQKKTVYVEKTLRICAIQIWQSSWSFLTIVRIVFPKFCKKDPLDFRRKLFNCSEVSRWKKLHEKSNLDR